MRIRTGFVSNSSSSSFLVFGEELADFNEMLREVRSGGGVIAVVQNAGDSGDVADIVLRITLERAEFLERHGLCGANFIRSAARPVDCDGEFVLDGKALSSPAYVVEIDLQCPRLDEEFDFEVLAARKFRKEADTRLADRPFLDEAAVYCKMPAAEALEKAAGGAVLAMVYTPDWLDGSSRRRHLVWCGQNDVRRLAAVQANPESLCGVDFLSYYGAFRNGEPICGSGAKSSGAAAPGTYEMDFQRLAPLNTPDSPGLEALLDSACLLGDLSREGAR